MKQTTLVLNNRRNQQWRWRLPHIPAAAASHHKPLGPVTPRQNPPTLRLCACLCVAGAMAGPASACASFGAALLLASAALLLSMPVPAGGRALAQCSASSTAVAGGTSSTAQAVAGAVASAFSDVLTARQAYMLPPPAPPPCDPHTACLPPARPQCRKLPPDQSCDAVAKSQADAIAQATATAIAQTASSVEVGCRSPPLAAGASAVALRCPRLRPCPACTAGWARLRGPGRGPGAVHRHGFRCAALALTLCPQAVRACSPCLSDPFPCSRGVRQGSGGCGLRQRRCHQRRKHQLRNGEKVPGRGEWEWRHCQLPVLCVPRPGTRGPAVIPPTSTCCRPRRRRAPRWWRREGQQRPVQAPFRRQLVSAGGSGCSCALWPRVEHCFTCAPSLPATAAATATAQALATALAYCS